MNDYMKLLGLKVKDRVTGFTGVVESVSFDLYGCVQMVIRPPMGKDGNVGEGRWFDAKRLEVLDKKPVMTVPAFETTPVGAEKGPAAKPHQSNIAR